MNEQTNFLDLLLFISFAFSLMGTRYLNLWIYYKKYVKRYHFSLIMNPFSSKPYELLITSIFTFYWRIEGEYQTLKKVINGFMLVACISFTVILIYVNNK